jgi:outer membrane protein TolC
MGGRLEKWAETFEGSDDITLADCFRLALLNSEALLIRGEKILVTWTFEQEAISSLLPEVSLDWKYTNDSDAVKFSGQTITPRDRTETWLSLKQTVFDGRSLAAVPAAREARKIERLRIRDERDRLLFAVASVFYEILGLEHDVKVFDSSLSSAQEFYRVVEARRQSGEASRQEAMSAKSQREQVAALYIQARHDVLIARSNLARLIGLLEVPAKLIDTYTVTTSPEAIPILKEVAFEERSDLEAARAAVALAKAQRLAEYSDYLPLVTAEFKRWLKQQDGAYASQIDWNLSLDMTWTLFDSFGREARQARALSGIRQRELDLSALEKQIRYQVEEAVLSFDSLTRVLGALRSRAEASAAALELAEAEYRANEATNLDVELSRRAWVEAARDLARTELAQKLAALRIQLVIGEFKVSEPLTEAVEILKE